MLTKAEEQKVALRVLVYGARGDLAPLKTSEEKLRREISGLKVIPLEDVDLPRFR
jgi:hypothetical protein